MGGLSPVHWLIVALIFVLLFGAKKLPEMARSLGQSARVFKSEIKGLQDDDEARAKQQSAQQPPAQQQALPATQASVQTPVQAEPKAPATEGSSSSDTPR